MIHESNLMTEMITRERRPNDQYVTGDDAAGDIWIYFEFIQRVGDFFHESVAEGVQRLRSIQRDHRNFFPFAFLLDFDKLE